jgi:hypothetical protein
MLVSAHELNAELLLVESTWDSWKRLDWANPGGYAVL